MRQRILSRLFAACLVLGILSWGGSFVSFTSEDFSFVNSVCAQDAEEGDEEMEEEEGDAEGEEADAEGEEADAEGEETEDEDAEEGDEEADGEGDEVNDGNPGIDPAAGVVPFVPQTPVSKGPNDFELKQAIEKMDAFGGYAALWKIIAAILVYLVWVRSLDWMSTDCIYYGFNIKKWIPLSYGCFWGGMVMFWLIPFFWVSYLFLLAGCIVPMVLFVKMHNQDLSSGEQVFTPEHLRFVFSRWMAKVGVNVSAKAKDRHEIGFPVVLNTHGKNKEVTEPWRIQARAHDGFPNAREILSHLMVVHPEGLMLDYTSAGVASRYLLDGVWTASESFTRELADPALQALKILCGLKPEDRKSKQTGTFDAEFEYDYTFPEDRLKVKAAEEELKEALADECNKARIRECERALERVKEAVRPAEKRKRKCVINLTTQGTPTGERAVFMFEQGKSPFKALDDLGMQSAMVTKLREQLGSTKGFFLFAAPNSSGLRTTVKMAISRMDRYKREFYEIEDGIHEYDEIENVTKYPIHAKDPEGWKIELRNLYLKDPNVIICRDILSHEVLDSMLDEVITEERLMITTVRAKDAAEALLRIMATKCDAKKWVENIQGVLCQRLVRKLCKHCKESYAPPAETLKMVGATEKIRLFRQPVPVQPKPGEEAPAPCAECHGLGYSGRTAIFELVVVGYETRNALLHTPKLELVRAALKKDGNTFMLQEGLRLVREGETSLQELKRALS